MAREDMSICLYHRIDMSSLVLQKLIPVWRKEILDVFSASNAYLLYQMRDEPNDLYTCG